MPDDAPLTPLMALQSLLDRVDYLGGACSADDALCMVVGGDALRLTRASMVAAGEPRAEYDRYDDAIQVLPLLALRVVLDQIDYAHGNAEPGDAIGQRLAPSVMLMCRASVAAARGVP